MTDFLAQVTETVEFSDTPAKLATRKRVDAFALSDVLRARSVVANRAEPLEFIESAERSGAGIRGVADGFQFSDVASWLSVIVRRREAVQLYDAIYGAANAVINYLTLLNKGSREDEMLQLFDHGPAGFSKFKRFFPGTFRFQDMIIKTTMATRERNTRPRLSSLSTTIDVADKRFQGSASVTLIDSQTTGKTVVFAAEFYAVPEVVLMWKAGAEVGRAELVSVARDHFVVKVFSLATGNPIAGDITYAALGY